ncbi:MAG TPA: DUF4143 domain-containing protein, partial [Chromatiales bacterium]|nr:DUF4143 domain-containing protein [Chromatiales bacterium]
LNAGETSNLYFWRDRSGHEIDVLIDHGTHLAPVEIKAGQTLNRDCFKGLEFWRKLAGDAAGPAWLVHGGDARQVRAGIEAVPWKALDPARMLAPA